MLTLAALVCGGIWQARGGTAPAFAQTPPTTKPNLLEQLLKGLFPTTTTLPPAPPTSGAAPPDPSSPPGSAPGPQSDDAPSSTGDRTVPADAQRIINSVVRTGSNNTLRLLEALRQLNDVGLSQEEIALIGMGQFPVAGEAYWSDDWLHPRFTPEFHFHQGTDVFAARGTPVRSPVDGVFTDASGGAGGISAGIRGADGTYYYMAHLDSFPRGLSGGQRVKQGQVVGFVGTSGNAEGGAPHLHLQVHPGGGAPVNPKPFLDRWLEEAIANVPNILAQYRISLPRPLAAAGMLRRLDSGSLGPPAVSDGPQLWARSVRRDGNGIRIDGASLDGDVAASEARARGAASRAVDWQRAELLARHVLAPLTPKVLDGVLIRGG